MYCGGKDQEPKLQRSSKAGREMVYGLWFWAFLEFLGLCRTLFWGCYGVGKAALVVIEMVIFGPPFLIAY